ncbi:MAG: T9SS type A sorting domain-containing protein [Saprospiraceae bacterium]|nr:T9SS type A sorting domain-containing protein [Saprospiraceae bacterium]
MIIRFTISTLFWVAAIPSAIGQAEPLAFTYGDPGITERGIKVVEDEEGNFLFIGDRYIQLDTSGVQPTNVDLEYFKINPEGEVLWSGYLDSTIADGGISVLAESGGGYTLLAKHCDNVLGGVGCNRQNPRLYRIDEEGNILWHTTYYSGFIGIAANFVKTPDGGYVIMGMTTKYSELGDLFLLKVDANGAEVWEATVPTTGGRAFDVAPAPGGGYYIAGSSIETNGRTAMVSKISEAGEVLWTQFYGKASFTGKLLQPFGDGFGLLLTNITSDFFPKELMRMDANGALIWEKDLISDIDRPTSAVATENGVVVTGLDELVSTDNKVAKVVKYDLNGNLVWAKTHDPYPDHYEHPTDIISTENGFVIAGFTELADTVIYVYPEDLMLFLIDPDGDLDSLEVPNAVTETNTLHTVIVYPNPASDFVAFQLSDNRNESYELLIFNTLGQPCETRRFSGPGFRLDRNGLSDGLYYFEIRSLKNELIAKGKLILE